MHALSNEALLAAISVIVAALAVAIPIVWRFLQSSRLRQVEAMHRESHNLKLFEALASGNHQLQLAAAAVLVERLVPKLRNETRPEHRVIIRALLAVTKDMRTSTKDPGVSYELAKFVADQVAEHHKIHLKEFDWQNTQISGAWWPNIDASGADFWRADLRSIGMRNADLRKSVLVEARLDKSVLVGANLTNARLDRADLTGADLTATVLVGATFVGARYDKHTKFPNGFSPSEMELENVSETEIRVSSS